jgi:uncharacterized protein YyaL (SSP411 family)
MIRLRTTITYFALLTLLCTCGRGTNAVSGQPEAGFNHLAGEKSPYLLQHAKNPVDWYPWNDEALAKAKAENKLLIISVGYAACHWCHVMEHESFEDSLVAATMNEYFVSIKVDREERPDIDDVYMTACQLASRKGCGWPLNAIALPDGRAIWAGTYFPKSQWLKVLGQFSELQKTEPGKLEEYAASLTEAMVEQNTFQPILDESRSLSAAEIDGTATMLKAAIDFKNGGTRGAPKFPMPVMHEFLLTHHFHTGDKESLRAVETTLDEMAAGGIFDQIEGGFARYSTDGQWLVPHFEKMLYDNAQLVSLYAHAYQLTGKERYAEVVRHTLEFVDQKLTHPQGLFYASLDADTDGEEGLTYIWTLEEIKDVLGDEKLANAYADYFGITARGNWEGHNILTRRRKLGDVVKMHGYADEETLKGALETASKKLLAVREKRSQPGLDDKALTAWNSLMITGYADAYRALGDDVYRERAVRAAEFLWNNVRKDDNRLDRNFKDGASAINAFLDDYGLYAQACLDVYQITFDEKWIERANDLVTYADAHFLPGNGLYTYTSDLDPPLVTGNIPVSDQVIPSGNSIMARVQHQLGTLTVNEQMTEHSKRMVQLMQAKLTESGPRFFANWGRLYLDQLEPTYEVAILGADAGAKRVEMSKEYLPNVLFLGGEKEGNLELLTNKLNPGATTIYVCLEKVCQLPVTEAKVALGQMGQGSPE